MQNPFTKFMEIAEKIVMSEPVVRLGFGRARTSKRHNKNSPRGQLKRQARKDLNEAARRCHDRHPLTDGMPPKYMHSAARNRHLKSVGIKPYTDEAKKYLAKREPVL
jgi:hypothetical protein